MRSAEQSPGRAASPRARIGVGAAIVIAIVALAITVGIGIVRGAIAPVETVQTTGATNANGANRDADNGAPDSAAVYVYVSGAVASAGLYVLRDGDRVVDAVAAAGGFVSGADEQAVNLARVLSDGEQLHVPLIGDAAQGSASQPAGDGKVNLNTADTAALDTLPRIGPALAERIIQWRDANGRFTSIEDLLAVPGIGDKMLESLRDLVTI